MEEANRNSLDEKSPTKDGPQPLAPQRRWLNSDHLRFLQNSGLNHDTFTVMSYNILSQQLLIRHNYLYRKSPNGALNWENRISRLLYEIRCHNPDILCLQELEEVDYHNVIAPQLFYFGYNSLYKKKTGNSNVDGCAIFFKTSKFFLEQYVAVEYKKLNEPVLSKHNVGLVALFHPFGRANNVKFCVATTHLFFGPRRGDVKLAQLRILLAEIDKMAFRRTSADNEPKYHPVIMCGDFNSVPFSPLYNFITNGSLCCKNLQNGNVSGQEEGLNRGPEVPKGCIDMSHTGITQGCQYEYLIADRSQLYSRQSDKAIHPAQELLHKKPADIAVTVDDKSSPALLKKEDCVENMSEIRENNEEKSFYHNFNFVSAYKHTTDDGSSGVTTCHSNAKCTVDYIFYTSPRRNEVLSGSHEQAGSLLTVLGFYSLFTADEMDLLGHLPNWSFPSDHMSLVTQFALI